MSADRRALLPLAQARAVMLARIRPLPAVTVAASEAEGRVLAADLLADRPVPAVPSALVDGWAIEGLAISGAGPYAPVPLVPAPLWVEANEALPSGTDTILPDDAIVRNGVMAEAIADAPPGEGVRSTGEDVPVGTMLARAGDRITARLISVCAIAGIAEVSVRALRVAILPIMATEGAHDPVPVLRRLVATAGGAVTILPPAPCDPNGLAEAIASAANGADCVLVVGGTGDGRSDHARAALEAAGALAFHGIALRPGSTAGFGEAGGVPVLLLPRRLDAALAAWLALGRPLVAALAGAQDDPARTRLALARKLVSAVGMTELHFFTAENGLAEPLGCEAPPLSALLRASHAAFLPPESEGIAAGDWVELERLPA